MGKASKYKDTLFRKIFKEPKQAILLYNLIGGRNYDTDTPIEVNTLEDAVFNGLENDVSFVIEDKLVIFIEHQSTINNNMPLRFIEYLAASYALIESRLKYKSRIIKLPKPEFYVLYNGKDKWDKEYLKLSDAFDLSEDRDTYIELCAKVINIKPDSATVDIKKDNELYVYSVFVSKVGEFRDGGDPTKTALRKARSYCAENGLSSNMLNMWEEVKDMYLAEIDYLSEEKRNSYFDGKDEGRLEGILDVAINLIKMGTSLEDISNATGIEIGTLRTIRA